jgi:HSP20 family protein
MKMFGFNRWTPFDEMFNFQREADRLLDRFWSDLPSRTAARPSSPLFQVRASDEAWRIDVPLPGIDPRDVDLEVVGHNVTIRVKQAPDKDGENSRNEQTFEQTFTVPQFLDLDRITAAHHHGMLQLTVPLKESVRPRRIQIDTEAADQKRLTAVA